jgi:hypothetical protein
MLFFNIGDAVGWIRKDKAKAPATLEKSGLNSSYYPKLIVPSAIFFIKVTIINTK